MEKIQKAQEKTEGLMNMMNEAAQKILLEV